MFDRFYRTDAARNRETGGLGLGLNLAVEIARAHGGDIVIETNERDSITFRADLLIIVELLTRVRFHDDLVVDTGNGYCRFTIYCDLN